MQSLTVYAAERLRAGAARAQIEGEMALLGWSPEQARSALREALIGLGAPAAPVATAAPQPSTALDVGMSLFGFALLAIVVWALVHLGFGLADQAFPDPLGKADAPALARSIHSAMASLAVALPGYALAMRWWFARYRVAGTRREPALTRWFTYGVLLCASLTMIGDLITVVYAMLQGEATTRFALKAAWLLLLAALVVALYGLERRQLQYGRSPPRGALASIGATALLLALAGLALGLKLAGTPTTARAQALDVQRAQRLLKLAGCVERYARNGGELPQSLDALLASPSEANCATAARDPLTQAAFDYRVLTPMRDQGSGRSGRFELCAHFERAAPASAGAGLGPWQRHAAGRECRALDVRTPAAAPR
jgi:hypothetical protein